MINYNDYLFIPNCNFAIVYGSDSMISFWKWEKKWEKKWETWTDKRYKTNICLNYFL